MKTCSVCGKEITERIVRGYIHDPGFMLLKYSGGQVSSIIACPECNAELEKQWMIKEGYAKLFLREGCLRDWYEVLSFDLTRWSKTIRHTNDGKTSTKMEYWFVGPDKHEWHGIAHGDSPVHVRCYRTKKIIN